MECVTCLLKQASSDVICELYDRKYAPKLGQGIYIAIQMAQWEKLRPLRYNFPVFNIRIMPQSPFQSFDMRYKAAIPKLCPAEHLGSVSESQSFTQTVTIDFPH